MVLNNPIRTRRLKNPKAWPKGSRNFPEKPIVDQKQKPPDLAESPQKQPLVLLATWKSEREKPSWLKHQNSKNEKDIDT